jgi:uncharacterized membrane protein
MPIDWGIVARAIRVVAVVVWIGGVGLVTTVLVPAMGLKRPEEWIDEFDAIEHRFAPQVRIAAVLVLVSGLYMLYAYDLWDRFADGRYWWMHLMVGVWLLFAALLFVIEPLMVRNTVHRRGAAAPEVTLTRMLWMHRLMLTLSLLAIFAAVAGAHGLI